jgi:hypothetical protein
MYAKATTNKSPNDLDTSRTASILKPRYKLAPGPETLPLVENLNRQPP